MYMTNTEIHKILLSFLPFSCQPIIRCELYFWPDRHMNHLHASDCHHSLWPWPINPSHKKNAHWNAKCRDVVMPSCVVARQFKANKHPGAHLVTWCVARRSKEAVCQEWTKLLLLLSKCLVPLPSTQKHKYNLTVNVQACNNSYFQARVFNAVRGYLLISTSAPSFSSCLALFFSGRLPSFADVTPGGEQRKQETNSTVSNRHLCKLKVERGNGLNAGASKANKRTLWTRERPVAPAGRGWLVHLNWRAVGTDVWRKYDIILCVCVCVCPQWMRNVGWMQR